MQAQVQRKEAVMLLRPMKPRKVHWRCILCRAFFASALALLQHKEGHATR